MSTPAALRLVVIGVLGCGRSTLAAALGQALHLNMGDCDNLHLPGSVSKMQAGVPLTDADHWPWLDRVASCLRSPPELDADQGGRVVDELAISGNRRQEAEIRGKRRK